jgi:hypothetical protein
MADRLQVVGGPLDGHEIPKQAGRHAWIGARRAIVSRERFGVALVQVAANMGGSATTTPTDGRALYELLGGVYVYAGHRTTYCNECGCYHGRAEGGAERRPCALGG